MNYKVQSALKAREKKRENNHYTSQSRVNAALEERKNRLASDVDEEYINQFITEMNLFYSSTEDEHETMTWGNATSWYNSKNSQWQDLSSKASKVRAWLELNKNALDSKTYDGFISTLDGLTQSAPSIVEGFKERLDYFSQWQTADDYYAAKCYADIMSYVEEGRASENYDEFVQQGKAAPNPTAKESQGSGALWWKEDPVPLNNIVEFHLAYKKELLAAAANGQAPDFFKANIFHMSQEEIDAYNYLFAKRGKDTADKYLDWVLSGIKEDKSVEFYEKYLKGNSFAEGAFSLIQGFDSFGSGLGYAAGSYNDDRLAVDIQSIGSMAREGLADDSFNIWYNFKTGEWNDEIFGSSVGQTLYDLGSTTANMAPSIAIGSLANTVAPGFGVFVTNGLMGLSSGGNAYKEALDMGYTEEQAKTYGTLVGSSEALLGAALGAIGNAGKSLTGKAISKIVKGLDSGFARFAVDFGGKLASEALEEGLQEALVPLFENIASGAGNTWDDIDWSQVGYSALLGSLSAFGLEGSGVVANNVRYNSAIKAEGNSIVKNGGVESLVGLANEMAGVADASTAKNLSARVNKVNGKSGVNVKAVGKLSEAVNDVRSQLNKTDIVKSLESKGITSKKAQKYADTLVSMNEEYFAGKKSTLELGTNAEWNKITKDENAYAVLREVVTDMNSSVNARNAKYKYARQGINMAEDGTLSLSDEHVKKMDESVLKDTYAKKAEDIEVAVSKDGKTRVISTDAEVTVNGIDRIETVKVKGEDGETHTEKVAYLKVTDEDGNESSVELGDVKFGSRKEAILYDTFASMDIDPAHFDAFIKNFNEADYNASLGEAAVQYALGFQNAYRYGWANMETELGLDVYASKLTDTARNIAYTLGKETISKQTETKQKALDAAVAERKSSGEGKVKTQGKLHMEGVTTKKRTAMQNAGVGLAKRLTSLGIDVYIYESHQDANGNWVDDRGEIADNGFYRAEDGSIHIDLNAGRGDSSLMAYTLSHELVHFMRANAPAEFKVFADLLYKWYGKKGVSIVELTSSKMTELDCDWDTAYEEVIADSCESFLTDSNIADRITELQEADKGTWETIRDKVLDFLKWMKSLFVDVDPDSAEGRFLRQYKDEIDHLYDAFYNTLASATDTFQWVGSIADAKTNAETLATAGITVDADTGSAVMNSVRYAPKTQAEVDKVAKALAESVGVSIDKAKAWVKSETSLSSIILDPSNAMFLDYEADDRYEAIKKNAEYPQGTVDFSNLCKKRREFTALLDKLQKEHPNRIITAAEMEKIRQVLIEENVEVACGLCYVEERRQLLGEIAQGFIDGYKDGTLKNAIAKGLDAKDNYVPTIYDLITYDGYRALTTEHPTIASAFQKFNNARGMQAGRLIEGIAEYKRDILKWSQKKVDFVNSVGGLRVFSFSDFEATHLIDLVQVVQDCAAKGVMIQAYTKVPAFANAVKDTNMKVNRSLIAKGTGVKYENGKMVLDLDPVEGIDIYDKDFFDSTDSESVGNVLVGMSNEQIRLAMKTPFVDYIIPFHTGLKGDILKAKKIDHWDNYKNFQTDKEFHPEKVTYKKDGSIKSDGWVGAENQINVYVDVIQAAEAEGKPIKNKVDFVNKFLAVAKEKGLKPRFWQFLDVDANGEYTYTEGYHKFLVDFKLFDKNGNILPQKPVVPVFDDALNARILKEYVAGKKAPVTRDAVYDRLEREVINGEGVKKSTRSKRDLEIRKKSYYNEFATNAMQWANKADRQSGDNTIIYDGKRKKYILLEALEEGYFEVATGTYEEMRGLYERAHRGTDYEIHADSNETRTQQGRGLWDMQLSQNRGNDDRNVRSSGSQGLQDDTSRGNEHLRSGNQGELVKKSSRRDSKGRELTENQQEFFVNSKVRDADGNLMPVYHGTPTGGFTTFEMPHYLSTLMSAYGAGFYFTDEQNAKQYMKPRNGKVDKNRQLYEVYLNITNPMEITPYSDGHITDQQMRDIFAHGNYEWGVNHIDVEKEIRINKLDSDRLATLVRVFNGDAILDAMKEVLGYDGVRFTDQYGDIWVAWEQSQIKSTSNKNPTKDPDIRYSRRATAERDAQYLDAVNRGDTETVQKMVEEAARRAGYDSELLHHGTDHFGFTKIDVTESEDGISFFATDNFNTAASYVSYKEAYDEIREIGKAKRKNKKVLTMNSSIKDFLDYLGQELPDSYADAHVITKAERYELATRDVRDAVDLAKELLKYSIPKEVEDLADLVLASESDQTKWDALAKKYKQFKSINEITYNGQYFNDASVVWYNLQDEIGLLNMHLNADLAMVGDVHESKGELFRAYEKLVGGQNAGIYGLYAKQDNQLVIRGGANNWNNIPLGDITAKFNEWWVNEKGYEPAANGYYTRGNTRNIAEFAKYAGYRSVCFVDIYDFGGYGEGVGELSNIYAFFNPQEDVKSADPITYDDKGNVIPLSKRFDSSNKDIRYSKRQKAPTFYSYMGVVVDGVKQDKLGSASVINMLKGKGVKDEEIKWSGIETWLEGKKSVTKAELQEFIAGSQLQIGEQMSGINQEAYDELEAMWKQHTGVSLSATFSDDFDNPLTPDNLADEFDNMEREGYDVPFIEDQLRMIELARQTGNEGRWSKYKLAGGRNYREIVFTMPNSSYSNDAMMAHWGQDAEGVLAHARIQDFVDADGKKMLFVEEIQSDWHNAGQKNGYGNANEEERAKAAEAVYKAAQKVRELETEFRNTPSPYDLDAIAKAVANGNSIEDMMNAYTDAQRRLSSARRELENAEEASNDLDRRLSNSVPDAPFRDTYQEFVLKRLIRMAAEEGYDSIGWTTAQIQSDRWSDVYAEGYRIEYDQDIPKFLRKYGKKWGATVGKADIQTKQMSMEEEMETALLLDEWIDDEESGLVLTDEEKRNMRGMTEVWSMPITDSMKDSVLYEGQVMYQRRGNSTSNRSLLANALEGVAQNDSEARRLAEYKEKIDLINAEEQKLYETRERIAELSFAKGPKDTVTINNLQATATRIANRINTYDKQLLRLEATAPLMAVLEREKTALRKREKQKMAEAVAKYREKSAETLREVMKRNTESRKKNVESRKRTAVRNKIKGVVTDLNSLLNRGTKERNVKTDMQETVGSALKLANILFNDEITNEDIVLMGSTMATEEEQKLLDQYAELIKKRDSSPVEEAMRAINKMSDLNRKLADLFKRERAKLNKASVSEAIDELAKAYASLQGSDKNYVNFAYNEEVHKRLMSLSETLGGTVVKDMSLAQLEEVYDAYKMIRHMVRESNSLFRMGKTEDLANKVTAVQEQILSYYKERKNDPREGSKEIADFFSNFAWNEMKPVTAFETLGADAYTELFWDAIKAESEWARWMEESKAFLDEQRNKYGYKSWKMEDAHEFTLPNGKVFRLTLQDMMSIYAYSKRDQAEEHMTVGGFQFDKNKAYKDKSGKKRVHLGDLYVTDWTTISNIIGELTNEQRQYVDAVQSYLTDMGKRGNEVSEILYGIGIFNEQSYFPLMSARDYRSSIEEALNNTQTMASLKNTGMTKQTVPHASNPIILQGFDDVVIGHIDKMAKYCTHVLAIENLRRVFDSVSADDNGGYVSTKAVIEKVFGESAKKYFDKYITDLNGGTLTNDNAGPTMALFSKFKGTAVGASLSVIVQQPMAIIRAMDVIDLKHFIFGKVGKAETKHLYDEIKRYAPIATIKEMGGFDVGSSRTAREYLGLRTDKGFKRAVDKANDVAMWGAGKADELGWGIIWKAVKREVASTKGLKPGTAEFYEACGERFTEVIVRTQVYDSVNSRSGFMRSKSDLLKFATSFMGEPTTVVNQAYLAALKVQRANSKAEKRKAVRGLGRTMGVLLTTTLLTTVAKSLVYAMRDDDDDEAFLERWAKHTGESLGLWGDLNPLTLLPYARDIVSIFEGWDVERPDMSLVTNLITSSKKLFADGTSVDEVLTVIGDVANLFGIPAKNVIRDSKAITNLFGDIFDDVKPTDMSGAFVRGLTGKEQSNAEALYDAIINGDTGKVAVIKGKYKDEDAVTSAMRSQIKEHYLAGDINSATATQYLIDHCGMDSDDAYWKIHEWDNAENEDYDKYDEFISAVSSGSNIGTAIKQYTDNGVEKDSLKTALGNAYKDNTLSKDSVERALTAHFDMDSNDAYWLFDRWDYAKANGSSDGYSKYGEFYTAVESGRNLKDTIKRYTDHGVEAETLARQITTYFKPLYREMSNAERANIKGYLLNAYALLGYNRVDKNEDINNWLKD